MAGSLLFTMSTVRQAAVTVLNCELITWWGRRQKYRQYHLPVTPTPNSLPGHRQVTQARTFGEAKPRTAYRDPAGTGTQCSM